MTPQYSNLHFYFIPEDVGRWTFKARSIRTEWSRSNLSQLSVGTSFHPHARKDKVHVSARLSVASSGQIPVGPRPAPPSTPRRPVWERRAGLPTRAPVPARPSLERPLSPAPRSAETRPSRGREARRSAYLDQLLGGQSRAGGWRRRRRVVVRVFQIVSGEERRIAGRVRSAQHRLELREHGLVLRGRRLGHWSQAGAHGQHPRGHGRSGGYGSGVRGDRRFPPRPGWHGTADSARGRGGGPLGRQPDAHEGGHEDRSSWARPRVTAEVLRPPLSPAPPQGPLALSPEPAPATSKLRQQAKRARTCPATTDT